MESVVKVIDWRITALCQCECDFCYGSEHSWTLSRNQLECVLDAIKQSGCEAVCISGGEPLLYKNTCEVIRRISEMGKKVYLSTNGYLYLNNIEKIEPYITKLSLPLDGYDADSNTINGRRQDSFDAVLKILKYYKTHSCSFAIKIGTVVTQRNNNTEHFERMKSLIQNYSIGMWKIYEFIPEGRGYANRYSLDLSTEQREEFEHFIDKLSFESDFCIRFISKERRDAAYLIILPTAEVMIPISNGDCFNEKVLGSILYDDWEYIESSWKNEVLLSNYNDNSNSRNIGVKSKE